MPFDTARDTYDATYDVWEKSVECYQGHDSRLASYSLDFIAATACLSISSQVSADVLIPLVEIACADLIGTYMGCKDIRGILVASIAEFANQATSF